MAWSAEGPRRRTVASSEPRASAGGYDHMKRMLLACEALAAREDAASQCEARKLARELASQHDTSAWAKAMLERLSTP
jgi:hypothetical protein